MGVQLNRWRISLPVARALRGEPTGHPCMPHALDSGSDPAARYTRAARVHLPDRTAMLASVLRLLLVLTLALNGFTAPGMAGHDHQAGASADGPATAHSHHQGHHHGAPAADHEKHPTRHHGPGCCDGTTCQCGCVLPPAVAFAMSMTITRQIVGSPDSATRHEASSPPRAELLRPPIA